jgi:Putative addiction module component
MGINPSDLASLSVEEKLAVISDLWDSIDATADRGDRSAAPRTLLIDRDQSPPFTTRHWPLT